MSTSAFRNVLRKFDITRLALVAIGLRCEMLPLGLALLPLLCSALRLQLSYFVVVSSSYFKICLSLFGIVFILKCLLFASILMKFEEPLLFLGSGQ